MGRDWNECGCFCRLKKHEPLLTQTRVPVHAVIRENRCACCVSVPVAIFRGLDWQDDSKLWPSNIAAWKFFFFFKWNIPDILRRHMYNFFFSRFWTNIWKISQYLLAQVANLHMVSWDNEAKSLGDQITSMWPQQEASWSLQGRPGRERDTCWCQSGH